MEKNPHYLDHRKRLKERYRAGGIDGWHDYEVLELALTYGIPQKDLKPLAKELITRFGGLSGVLHAPVEELVAVKGLGEHTALLLRLFNDLSTRCLRREMRDVDVVSSPAAALRYLQAALGGCRDEEFHALFLNSANRPVAVERIHTGTVNRSAIYPRKIVERALEHRATGVIIAHNHPSGTLQPSPDDRTATEAVRKALATVDISLLDHLIIGAGGGYFSWKENSLL